MELANVPHSPPDEPPSSRAHLVTKELVVRHDVERCVLLAAAGGSRPPAVPLPNPESAWAAILPCPVPVHSTPMQHSSLSSASAKQAAQRQIVAIEAIEAIETIDVT